MLGTTLLFWGAMTGRPLVGLVCALFVEARYWVKLRWDFNQASYENAWQLSFILMVLTAVVIWLDESRYTAILILMGWMPPILMPLQFVQSYGLRDSLQLSSFSLLARRSRLRSERLGLIHHSASFNFGNVTFVVTLLSSAVAMEVESHLFLPGLVVLCGWMLLSSGRCRWRTLMPVLVIAGGLGLAGQHGLEYLEKWVRRGRTGFGDQFNPNFESTNIGQRGRVLLSPEVIWRMQTEPGVVPPRLLRTGTFRNFITQNWMSPSPFQLLESRYIDEEYHHIVNEELSEEELSNLPVIYLRGSVDKAFSLPIANSTASIEGMLDAVVKKNRMGTVQVEPPASVINAGIHWDAPGFPEESPRKIDTKLPGLEEIMIKQVCAELGLADLPNTQSKLAFLKQWFNKEFRYTLDLTIHQATQYRFVNGQPPVSALKQFLTKVRAGHCEYFATAATLLLREAGVPARYAVGFGVMEKSKNPNEYLIRGTHAHAWCRVWDDQSQQWIDFDPTPADWMGGAGEGVTWMQNFKDTIKRVREDFFLWRNDPKNELLVMVVVGAFGLGLALVVVRRLWRSRSRLDDASGLTVYDGEHEDTPLYELEALVRRCIGPRPTGMTYGAWLRGVEDECGQLDHLGEAIVIHQQWRFDPQPVSESQRQRLRELVETLQVDLQQHVSALANRTT